MPKEVRNHKLIRFSLIFCVAGAILLFLRFDHAVAASATDTIATASVPTAAAAVSSGNILKKVLNIILLILGLADLGVIGYAGWMWHKSEGDEETIAKAKKVLMISGIALFLIMLFLAIVNIMMKDSTASPSNSGDINAKTKKTRSSSVYASVGNKTIEMHYPVINQKDTPRNTKIAITFREPVSAASIIKEGKINSENVMIYSTIDGADSPKLTSIRADAAADGKTFVFTPEESLGNQSDPVWYTVALSRNIRKTNNDFVFTNVDGNVGYFWTFEVGKAVDVSPAKISSVIPRPNSSQPRNILIQIDFDSPIDPTTISGAVRDGYDKIVVKDISSEGRQVAGEFRFSNLYKTVEFFPEETCGQNSCGHTVYCLPAKSILSVWLRPGSLGTSSSAVSYPYDGIVDMADNSFDGNGNGHSQGPQGQTGLTPYISGDQDSKDAGDDFAWSFSTTNRLEISSPTIIGLSPDINKYGVGLDEEVRAIFDRPLQASSLTKENIPFFFSPQDSEVFYWLMDENGTSTMQATAVIKHDQFYGQSDYAPEFDSGVKDIYQNCYSPAAGPICTPDLEGGRPYCCNGKPQSGNCQINTDESE